MRHYLFFLLLLYSLSSYSKNIDFFAGNDYQLSYDECIQVKENVGKLYIKTNELFSKLSCSNIDRFKLLLRENWPGVQINERATIMYRNYKKNKLLDTPPILQEIDNSLFYIRIDHFPKDISKIITRALNDIRNNTYKYLIIDLRNNTGGILASVIESSDLFVPARKSIASVEGRNSNNNLKFTSSRNYYPMNNIKIVTLVSNKTQSGAELFLSILKIYTSTMIIGEKTAGVGTVRTVIPLNPDKLLSITSQEIKGPNNYVIQGKGIIPDIEWPFDYDISNELDNIHLFEIKDTVEKYFKRLKRHTLNLKIPNVGEN